MVRTEAFLAAGGFDPVVRFPGEEERLSLDLAAAGWGMAYVDSVTVHHHPSPAGTRPSSGGPRSGAAVSSPRSCAARSRRSAG